ncbi:MAG: RnfABCDGE type electron transport complex subunit G [Bacteroidales bacterium]|nr:RnfABCDGE type electron transport complex subunit G [Bacteroidales bacterium]
MAAKSTLKNMLLCLTAVCLFCSAILAVTYAVTLDPIAEASQAKTNASIARVLPAFSGNPELLSVKVGDVEYPYYKTESGVAVLSTVNGFGGPLSLMVGITGETPEVFNTVVLSHSETPGLGAKCVSEDFSAQFKGWNPEQKKLQVSKDGGDVDAITASTITSRAYTLAIANAVEAYKAIAGTNEEGGQDNE